jgi:hypothetical protein
MQSFHHSAQARWRIRHAGRLCYVCLAQSGALPTPQGTRCGAHYQTNVTLTRHHITQGVCRQALGEVRAGVQCGATPITPGGFAAYTHAHAAVGQHGWHAHKSKFRGAASDSCTYFTQMGKTCPPDHATLLWKPVLHARGACFGLSFPTNSPDFHGYLRCTYDIAAMLDTGTSGAEASPGPMPPSGSAAASRCVLLHCYPG